MVVWALTGGISKGCWPLSPWSGRPLIVDGEVGLNCLLVGIISFIMQHIFRKQPFSGRVSRSMLIFLQTQAGLRCIQIHQRSTGKQLIFQTDVLGATIAAVSQVAFGLGWFSSSSRCFFCPYDVIRRLE